MFQKASFSSQQMPPKNVLTQNAYLWLRQSLKKHKNEITYQAAGSQFLHKVFTPHKLRSLQLVEQSVVAFCITLSMPERKCHS